MLVVIGAALSCCASSAGASHDCALDLRFIGAMTVPAEHFVDGDAFGGISGIDYAARSGVWYLVSDDRSEHAPARFFTATLDFDLHSVRSIQLGHSIRFQSAAYDPESIRFDPRTADLLVAGEGDTASGLGPWLQRVTLDGKPVEKITLPAQLQPGSNTGPRPNQSFEGLAFEPKQRDVWVALEAPLLEDGEPADPRHTADVRLTKLDRNGKTLAQFVYRTDPASDSTEGAWTGRGISEFLALGGHEFLVLERSGIKHPDGQFSFHTRLYCANAGKATDVSKMRSLRGQHYDVATKHLLFDFDTLELADGESVDNLEGISWGPSLGEDVRSLVMASDNNFAPRTPTQFLFFSVRGGAR